ncbi:hypothetical protein BGX34_010774 [Mortierella sp. NVP85]|nr:hypothetical protein BGX34_010774 [Mortierella sp. NVP85]
MNPVPQNLRHLEALFDHYNVDPKGHFLGESSSFYLSCKPVLPILAPDDPSATPVAAAASAPSGQTDPAASASDPSPARTAQPPRGEFSFTAPSRVAAASTHSAGIHAATSPPPEPDMGPGVPPADSAVHASSGLATNTPAYRDPEYPVVAHSITVMSQFPPPYLARELIVVYLSKVNRFMPLIPTALLDEYDAGVPQSPFLLLAIFAIASKYSTNPECRSDPLRAQTAGEAYCKAACRLVDEFLDCPRLSTVQGLFLLGKHLEECKNQSFITKSFIYIGMAIRMAMSMGLNRNCSGWGLDPIQVEYRNRTWWYLYVYDRAQGSCYGRPFLIRDQDCGADKPKPDPLARNPDQDSADVGHFLSLIRLSILLGRVVNTFYPTNSSGGNFHCSSKNVYGHAGGRAQVVDMLATAEASSSSAGSRKRSKTTNRPKGPTTGEASTSGSAATQGSTGAGAGRTPGGPQSHQDMLMRQHVANQKQDAIVAELDKELTDWVQALPPHLQWNSLQTVPNVFGDILHGLYYVVLILLHRPSVRVGELMPTTQSSKQDKCSNEADAVLAMEGCHSMAVCAQAARRITKLAERCQNLTHLERFGAGAYILLHAARVHLMLAAIPAPPRQTGTGPGGCGPSTEFIEAIRKKDQAVDQFHRSLGSLRKFSVYHWTVDGVGLSIRTLERTLAAILHEQELDHEQELEHQHQKLAEYDAGFFDQDGTMLDPNIRKKISVVVANEGIASENKSEEDSMHERTYYESMRVLEMRLLYQERHRYSKDNHLEEHLQHQDAQPLMNPGMDLLPRRGLLDPAVALMSHRSSSHNNLSDLFDKNEPTSNRTDGASGLSTSTTASSTPNIPELVIKAYKPNVTGKTKRRGGSNTVMSGSAGRNKTTSGQSKGADGNSGARPGTTADEATVQDDVLDTVVDLEPSTPDTGAPASSRGDSSSLFTLGFGPAMTRSTSGPGAISIATQARGIRGEMQATPQGSPSFMTGVMSTTWSSGMSEQHGFNGNMTLMDSTASTPTGQSYGGTTSISATSAVAAMISNIGLEGHGNHQELPGHDTGQQQGMESMFMTDQLQQQQHGQHQQQQQFQLRLPTQYQHHQQQHTVQQDQLEQMQPQHPSHAFSSTGLQAHQMSSQHQTFHQQALQTTQMLHMAYTGDMDLVHSNQPNSLAHAQTSSTPSRQPLHYPMQQTLSDHSGLTLQQLQQRQQQRRALLFPRSIIDAPSPGDERQQYHSQDQLQPHIFMQATGQASINGSEYPQQQHPPQAHPQMRQASLMSTQDTGQDSSQGTVHGQVVNSSHQLQNGNIQQQHPQQQQQQQQISQPQIQRYHNPATAIPGASSGHPPISSASSTVSSSSTSNSETTYTAAVMPSGLVAADTASSGDATSIVGLIPGSAGMFEPYEAELPSAGARNHGGAVGGVLQGHQHQHSTGSNDSTGSGMCWDHF